MDAMKKMLAEVVGPANVSDDPSELTAFLGARASQSGAVACFPGSTEEVQKLVSLAGEKDLAIYTTTDTCLPGNMNGQKGFILGFRRMQKIERIDDKNLAVHIERGVTYSQLNQALEPLGLKCIKPAAATSESVVENALNRAIMIQAVRFPDLQASNFKVVLPDGQIQKTGGHALGEEMSDWKDEGGPYLSKWYFGSGDIYGIITRGTIWIYPRLERRLVKAAGFKEMDTAMQVMKHLSRMDILNEAMIINRTEAKRLFPMLSGQDDPWFFIYGFESFSDHVDYLEQRADEPIQRAEGRLLNVSSEDLQSSVEGNPWFVKEDNRVGFYALFKRIPDILKTISEMLSAKGVDAGELPLRFVSFGSGRSVYCHVTFPGDAAIEMTDADYNRLMDAKAFFDRPLGPAANAVYGRAEGYLSHMKRLKQTLDPGYILNPGQPVDLEQ